MLSDRTHHKRVKSKPNAASTVALPTLAFEQSKNGETLSSRSTFFQQTSERAAPLQSARFLSEQKRFRFKTELPSTQSIDNEPADIHNTSNYSNRNHLNPSASMHILTHTVPAQPQQQFQSSQMHLRSPKLMATPEQIRGKKPSPMRIHHGITSSAAPQSPNAGFPVLNQSFKTNGARFSLNSALCSTGNIFARGFQTTYDRSLTQPFKPLIQRKSPMKSNTISTAQKYSMTKQQLDVLEEKIKEVELFNDLNMTITSDAPVPEDKKTKDLVGTFAVNTFYSHYKSLGKVQQQNKHLGITPSMQTDMLFEIERMNVAPSKLGLIKTEGDIDWLKLNHMHFGDKYATVLSNGLQKAKSIKRYHLQDNRISQQSSAQLVNCIGKQAKEINLASNAIGKIGCFNLSTQLTEPKTQIEVLNLEDNKLGDLAILQLLHGIQRNKTLRVLNLSKNNLTDKICPNLRQILEQRGLFELYLHWNLIQVSGGLEIFEGLKSNEQLKVLDMSYNNLGKSTVTTKQTCAAVIAEFIANNNELKHCDLSNNQFNRADSILIANALSNNKSIFGFHFSGNVGYVDSRGFLVIGTQEEEDATLFHQKVRIDGMKAIDTTMIRQSREKDLRDCCWICQGWKETQFTWRSGVSGFLASNPMFIHFNFEDFRGNFFGVENAVDDGFSKVFTYNRMIPPGELEFFYSGEDAFETAGDATKKFNYEGNTVPNVWQYEGNVVNVELKDLNFMNVHHNKQTFTRYDPLFSLLPRTRDQVYVPAKQKKKRVKWTFPISLFVKWRPDDDEILKRCFEFDWEYGKIPKLIKREEELAQVKIFFRENYRLIKDCYKNYATKYPVGDIWAIQNPAFLEFIEKLRVVDQKLIKDPDMNLKWVSTISSIPQADKTNPRNPVQAISRYQMMEVLVRIAEEKYVLKYKLTTNYFEAVKMLWDEHLQNEMNSQYNTQLWRSERYWVEECDLALKHYKKIVEHVYKKYSKLKVRPGSQPFMSLDELILICSKAGLSEEAHFGPNVALQAYNFSMMTQIDELQSDRVYQMSIVEFYEALGRIAEAASLKPLKGIYNDTDDEENPDAWPLERRKSILLGHKLEALLVRILQTVCDGSFRDRYPPIRQSFFFVDDDSDYELVSP